MTNYLPYKKLRFFGDSWYWVWYLDPKSSVFKNVYNQNNKRQQHSGWPVLEFYGNHLGLDFTFHNAPGCTFNEAVDKIWHITDNADYKYNIVFFSSPIRGGNFHEYKNKTYREIMNDIDKYIYKSLNNLQRWAEKHNQQVILIGGQSTLDKKYIKLEHKNLHLYADCLISKFIKRDTAYGMFKFADYFNLLDSNVDRDFVDRLYNDYKEFHDCEQTERKKRDIFLYPDEQHLNATGHLILLDELLYFIENLEKK